MNRLAARALSTLALLVGCAPSEASIEGDPSAQRGEDASACKAGTTSTLSERVVADCELGRAVKSVGRFYGTGGTGSAVVLDVGQEETVVLSAGHASSHGRGEAGAVADDFSASEGGELELLDEEGSLTGGVEPLENLFRPAIPADQTGESYPRLLPRHDHWLLTTSPGLRAVGRPYRAVEAGERIFAIGIPSGGSPQVTTCIVLGDAEARASVERVRAAGDEEGDIPYDPEAEGICDGTSVGGMSGGGVFGEDQAVVGTIVRGSALETGPNILRFTRATFAVAQFRKARKSATPGEQARAKRILP